MATLKVCVHKVAKTSQQNDDNFINYQTEK